MAENGVDDKAGAVAPQPSPRDSLQSSGAQLAQKWLAVAVVPALSASFNIYAFALSAVQAPKMRPLAAAMFVIISMPTVLLFAQFLRSPRVLQVLQFDQPRSVRVSPVYTFGSAIPTEIQVSKLEDNCGFSTALPTSGAGLNKSSRGAGQ
jgi:hypothetical protein